MSVINLKQDFLLITLIFNQIWEFSFYLVDLYMLIKN